MVCVNDDLEYARDQVRSYAATCAYWVYLSILRWKTQDADNLTAALPPEFVDGIIRLGELYNWYDHERRGAPHESAMTDDLIDAFVICGPPGRCRDMIGQLQANGVDCLSMVLYDLSDKETNMRRFVDEVLPGL
jgi:alkanesulfonate monooxygenase SsuD/methylene tetrahydromethanopterin reductase-like flavin-dependent oxidoreductase (luciferase family)